VYVYIKIYLVWIS